MRVLDDATKLAVDAVIQRNLALIRAVPGFVKVEPGFPVVDGAILREPAILIFVKQKKPADNLLREERAPRQLEAYRVCVMQADPHQQIEALEAFSDVNAMVVASASDLTYEPLEGSRINEVFEVSGSFLCHVGPDAGWPVLKPFLEATRENLSVAMYDFNADYIAKTFIDSVRSNGLAVTLTWDDGMTEPEKEIRVKLRSSLGTALDGWIVRCGGGRRFASAYHEKVAVRDSSAFWLSSGNWSLRSQPNIDPIAVPAQARGMYGKGNREWHVIIEDGPLAKLFEDYIRHDRDGSKKEKQQGDGSVVLSEEDSLRLPDLFVPIDQFAAPVELSVPEPVAPRAFRPSQGSIKVQPLLTPDNYLGHIEKLLEAARSSIYLQYSYITYSDALADRGFTNLLRRLGDLSYRPGLDLRIIVGSGDATNKIRKLAQAGFRESVFRVQSNVHNKGIIVDGETVLVSSANWSGDGVLRNRDAGLIIHDREIATYYQTVFLDDWDNRARTTLGDDPPVLVAEPDAPIPPGMVRMSWRDYYG